VFVCVEFWILFVFVSSALELCVAFVTPFSVMYHT
jgi:hypothetical protein